MISKYIIPRCTSPMSADKLRPIFTMGSACHLEGRPDQLLSSVALSSICCSGLIVGETTVLVEPTSS